MATDDHDQDSRKEQLSQGVEKAKEGARKLAGWLGRKLGDAADQLRDAPVVKEQVERLERFQEERHHARAVGSVEAVYDEWSERLLQAIDGLQKEIDAQSAAQEAVQYNINELRNRSVPESDPEMADYRAQVARMRTLIDECHEASKPFRAELERNQRQRRAALAQLEADATAAEALREQAQRQVAESRGRLPSFSDQEPNTE